MTWYAWGLVLLFTSSIWANFDAVGKQREPVTLRTACADAALSVLKIVAVVALALRWG